MEFISGYLDDQELRQSFNRLAIETFGLDFEPWFQEGILPRERYIPHALVQDKAVIANCSANLFDLVVDGREVSAVQLGTVMTDKRHRGRGYMAALMNRVLRQYQERELIYLFANDQVLDFYPKFGFHRIPETDFSLDVSQMPRQSSSLRRLDPSDWQDQALLLRLCRERVPVSSVLGVHHDCWPLRAACGMAAERLWRLEDKILVMEEQSGGSLYLDDILSARPFDLDALLPALLPNGCRRLRLGFVPQSRLSFERRELWEDDNALFVHENLLPGTVRFPETSHT